MSIGNIHVTDQYVHTPAGTWHLSRVNITTTDQTSTTTHTPAWAIVMTLVFVWFFLIGLLFLLARQTRLSGYVAVHIQAGPQSYTEHVPVFSEQQRADIFHRVRGGQRTYRTEAVDGLDEVPGAEWFGPWRWLRKRDRSARRRSLCVR